ncbi:hypothetical protein PUNSTDRAFT_130340 [Punctularia strigosozonata HHB-11173 SS5]|uniref:uncharacterized protein n=1 Tax=Punctularia strigosozonata (strain HHB-11173) TaxID=741275 RepID=UPI000441792D|nr:uncharacterized protein PUNSTDRAFT_130340 [Punctularia strigosozonata HHB-11173 SS5]EIN14713.1 hypothetical protein PUNSTDRAFT_130340 [Punctularia strigosozonata HHB-11173 SS5]
MSTQAAVKHHFIVYAPDSTDPEALSRRLSVRPSHLENAKKQKEIGFQKIGGAMLTEDSLTASAADRKFVGSVMIFEASSIDEVKKAIYEDVYYVNNVWDHDKLVILPFLSAAPLS